ncbi:sensor histidine kinase [Rhodohalobacter sp.]|uniref:sensor histidine kinase n=1 Tax=Rhodohalobacter sp. TaxID=1974210 RepID=UPI002ACDC75F|nr:sensor histidine kinase [Rhodohalobacter sp.]MDZ7758141.1 sensor histidine kinase [Rhodohalobacter sp.]
MSKLWEKYKLRVRQNCMGDFTRIDGLQYWRNRLFASIVVYLFPLGILILIPSAFVVYSLSLPALTAAYFLFGVAITLISLYGGFELNQRKYLFLTLIYTVATVLIFFMGEHGAGLTYLFGATIFALLILPTKAGVLTIYINVAVCLIHAALIHYQMVDYPLRESYQVASWLAISANSILLSIVSVIFLPMLFRGLQETIESQQNLKHNLIQHQHELEESLEEKETLLAEIHHRVKNNLAVISGMLHIQSFKESDKEIQEKLLNSTLRVKSMANIHEQLYQSKNFSKMEFDEGLKKLVDTILTTINHSKEVNVHYDLDSIHLNINQAVPCSLIVNEVVTNCLKHAFKDQDTGKIEISLKKSGNEVNLKILDDGIGISEPIDDSESESIGVELIQTLTKQLEGQYFYKSRSEGKGTLFELSFAVN